MLISESFESSFSYEIRNDLESKVAQREKSDVVETQAHG